MKELACAHNVERVPNVNIKVGTFAKMALAESQDRWYGTIVRLMNNAYIMADLPISNYREPLVLHEGDEVECRFTRFDGVYTFKTRFKSFLTDLNLVVMEKPDTLVKTEKRKHMRVPVYLQTKINGLYDGIVLNISAGGLLLTTNNVFNVGEVVQIDFELDQFPFGVMGEVVRLGGDNGYGIRFHEPGQSERIALENYILKKNFEDRQA